MSDASLLPWNATAQERALAEATSRLTDVPVLVREQWNPDTCPAALLPWLAWGMSVDQWDSGWTDSQKREAIKASFFVHRSKGTIGAVRAALTAIGLDIRVIEWFEDSPPGPPYTFRIEVTVEGVGVSQAQLAKAVEVVESAKNLRSHLADIAPRVNTAGAGHFAGVTLSGHDITIEPWTPSGAGVLTEDGLGILAESGALLITE